MFFLKKKVNTEGLFATCKTPIRKEVVVGSRREEQLDDYLIEYCKFVKDFSDSHKEEYAKRLDNYFTSPESRMREESNDAPQNIFRELYHASIEKTRDILMLEKEEGWDSLYESDGSPDSLYFKINMWNTAVNSDNVVSYRKESHQNVHLLTEEEKDKRIRELKNVTDELYEMIRKSVKKHWKPLSLLSGEYGQYNDVLYYDGELNLMILCKPDDNYYHWGGYEYRIGVPTKGRSHYDEKEIFYIHCSLNSEAIEYEYSEENEKRYRKWREASVNNYFLCRWKEC